MIILPINGIIAANENTNTIKNIIIPNIIVMAKMFPIPICFARLYMFFTSNASDKLFVSARRAMATNSIIPSRINSINDKIITKNSINTIIASESL